MTISKKQQIIAGSLMMTGIAFALSSFFSLVHVGFTLAVLSSWVTNFLMGWPVGFVVSALIASRIQRLVARLAAS